MTGGAGLAGVLAGLAVLVALLPAGSGPAARLARISHASSWRSRRAAGPPPDVPRRAPRGWRRPPLTVLAAVPAAAAVLVLVQPPAGLVLAAPAAVLAGSLVRRLDRPSPEVDAARLASDLPGALDLLASCLAAGAPVAEALAAVAEGVPGPLGEELGVAARRLSLGAPPEEALARLAAHPVLEPVSRLLARAVTSGTAPAEAVSRLAREARRLAREQGSRAARRAGVRVVLPLGLCFLPAFVLVGVVPVVVGAASRGLG